MFQWFKQRYDSFVYVDRIVIKEGSRAKGVGTMLYDDLYSWAKVKGLSQITCEINSKPPNVPSVNFHAKMGFK